MSTFQDKYLEGMSYEDLDLSENFKSFTSKFSAVDMVNVQNQNRQQYILPLFSVIFKDEISSQFIKIFSKLFIEFLECENKFFFRDKINTKLKTLLYQKFHNNINQYSYILQKIQYIIRNIEFSNLQFKVDLFRIERFFMKLILRKYTDNLVRGHRRFK